MKKIKIYFQNAENALGKQKPEEFENSTDHMAYAFSKNENVEMVLNIDEADYIIRHPDIGIQNEPLNPEREIIIDYFDSDNQMSNVLGCDTNCIMSRNPLLYFKRSCVDKTKNPYEYRKYNSPYTPITYGIKESYLNNISENENRNIDASCLFNHHDNGGNRSAVAQFMQRFKEQNTKYEIHVGRIGGGYSYNSSKHYFDQLDLWANAYKLFSREFTKLKGQSNTQIALRFCLSFPMISTTIPGMLTKAHVDENTSSSNFSPFTESELEYFTEIYKDHTFFVRD